MPGPARQLGTVLVGTLPAAGGVGGDLAAHEAADDPDGQGIDSNPTFVEIVGGKNYVIDAGANALLRQSGSAISTVSVFENRMVPKPPFLPPPGLMPMQSVPTTVVVGPDGALYVSELTGFPFPAGEARIWRVVLGSAPTVYATGLTNVTGLAFAGRTLYAVEFSSAGLLTVPEGEVPTGSLLRITPGASRHTVIAGGLTAPYGVAIRGGSTYVTTCGLCAGAGVWSRSVCDPTRSRVIDSQSAGATTPTIRANVRRVGAAELPARRSDGMPRCGRQMGSRRVTKWRSCARLRHSCMSTTSA